MWARPWGCPHSDSDRYLNVGSAVVLPEVFLKAISALRNLAELDEGGVYLNVGSAVGLPTFRFRSVSECGLGRGAAGGVSEGDFRAAQPGGARRRRRVSECGLGRGAAHIQIPIGI